MLASDYRWMESRGSSCESQGVMQTFPLHTETQRRTMRIEFLQLKGRGTQNYPSLKPIHILSFVFFNPYRNTNKLARV